MGKHREHAILVVVALLLVLGGLLIWHQVRNRIAAEDSAAADASATVVEMTTVNSQVWHPQIEAVGTILAEQGIQIASRADGVVQSINFKSGDFVNQGAVLVQLDTSVLKPTAEQSQAKYLLAKAMLTRNQQLYKQHMISISALQSAQADEQAAEGQMQEDAANLTNATITAPFSGNLGLRQINIGQFVPKGQVMVNLQTIDPVLVDFSLPEVYLHRVSVGDQVLVTTSAYPGQTFSGKITAMESQLNTDTRTLNIRAEVPNKNKLLIPGMFANIQVVIPTTSNVLTVPQMAIQYSPFGDTVFVVQNGRAVQRYINLGEQRGEDVEVTRGLAADETIISVGGDKVQNGEAVTTQDALAAAQQHAAEQKIQAKTKTVSTPAPTAPAKGTS